MREAAIFKSVTIICAGLICLLATTTLAADKTPAPAKPATHVTAPALPPACKILGAISEIRTVERAVTPDGSPSMLARIERHVVIKVEKSETRDNPPKDCGVKENDLRTYKLCSPLPVKAGERITGVEGSSMAGAMTCLFDIAVQK